MQYNSYDIIMTSSQQAYSCGTSYAALTVGLVAVYSTATLTITQWRTKFRAQMNKADNAAGTKAVDSLINFETVKVMKLSLFESPNIVI